MLEAVWDPVAGKVIFKSPEELAKENAKRENNEKKTEWRSSPSTEKRPRSRGLEASSFHFKPGQEIVKMLHRDIQNRVVERQTSSARQHQEWKYQAFKQLTVCKTFPLQNLAISHFRQLRIEWGVSEATHHHSLDRNYQDVDSAAESSSLASIEAPEAKRQLRGCAQSPAKSRHIEQYKNDFLQIRAISPNQIDPSVFGCALFCQEPRVFGVESSLNGKRRYICAHVGRFLDVYWRKTEANARHAYELIRPQTPCRLYMDLEYTFKENPDLAENVELQEQLLTELWNELAMELQSQFDTFEHDGTFYTLKPPERSQLVDLDSSTKTKFSRHWILHLFCFDGRREVLFADNTAVGYFLRQFVSRLAQEQSSGVLQSRRPVLHEHLFAKTRSKSAVDGIRCLLDLGVYTRNRIFRLMGSVKFGKNASAALRIAKSNEFRFPDGFRNNCFYAPERKESRDTNATSDDDVDAKVQESVGKTDWSMHAEAMAQTLVVPLNEPKIAFPILPHAMDEDASKTNTAVYSRHASQPPVLSRGTSPYPMLDDFVMTELANRGGTMGSIRAWNVDCDAGGRPIYLNFQMSRNRWCECVGREHKSNNIAWQFDLRESCCFQTCHDPDCRSFGFRGTPVLLPNTVREALQEALFEEELSRLDLDQLQANGDFEDDADDSFEKALAALNMDDLVNPPAQSISNDHHVQSDHSQQKVNARSEQPHAKKSQTSTLTTQRSLTKQEALALLMYDSSDEE